MIEVLLGAHLVLLFLLYRLMSVQVGRIIGIFYGVYLGGFMVIKPALLYYFGVFFPYSTNDPIAVTKFLIGSLIFLLVQYAGIWLLKDMDPPKAIVSIFDFDRASRKGIIMAVAILMAISFVGGTIKFGSPAYLVTADDSFAATMALAGGSYYINSVAEILVYGLVMFVSVTYWRLAPKRSFAYLVCALVATFFWTKLANRSTILVLILAWVSLVVPYARQKKLNILYVGLLGYILLIISYVVNFIRLGTFGQVDLSNAAVEAVYNAAIDMSPVDNAVMLYHRFSSQDLMFFQYLAGAITPLVMVPSSIFPFKLRPDKDVALTDLFFPNGAPETFYHAGSTLTFTIPGSGYADAYYFGTLVASILYVAIFCVYISIVRKGPRSARYIAAFYMLLHVAGYRLSIETMCISFYLSIFMIGFTHWLAFLPGGLRARPTPRLRAETQPS